MSAFRFGRKAAAAVTDHAREKLEALDRAQAIIEFEMDGTIITANANFLAVMGYELDEIRGDDFLGYLARVNFFRDGYGSTAADIWAPDGRLLAKSYQTFVIYG